MTVDMQEWAKKTVHEMWRSAIPRDTLAEAGRELYLAGIRAG